MSSVVVGKLVIFASQDGEKDWAPVKPEEVPAWLQDKETLGRMVGGQIVAESEEGPWYCAIREGATYPGGPVDEPVIAPAPKPRIVANGGIIVPGKD